MNSFVVLFALSRFENDFANGVLNFVSSFWRLYLRKCIVVILFHSFCSLIIVVSFRLA